MHIDSLSHAEVQSKIDALLRADDNGRDNWSSFAGEPFILTYRFETSERGYYPFHNIGNFTPYTETDKQAVRAVLDEFEAKINVQFVEADAATDAAFGFYKADDLDTSSSVGIGGQGGGYANGNSWEAAAIFLDTYDLSDHFALILHEIGHAMGLKHPGDYDVVAGHGDGPFLPPEEDHTGLTIMSYFPDPCTTMRMTSLQEYDVLALQHFWGAPEGYTDTLTPEPSGQIAGTSGNDTILGSEGEDTITAEGGDDTVHGHCGNDEVRGGAGNDELLGEGGHDRLYGGAGNDAIFGNAGNDVLYGGAGYDFFRGGDGNDVLIANDGLHDEVYGNTAYYSAAPEHWEISGGKEYAVLVGPGGERDKLIGIQYIQFGQDHRVELDGSSALDGLGAPEDFIIAERVALLYEAALNRDGAIDLPGLNFYIDVTERDDLSDEFLADDMMRSPEFAANFGDPDVLSNAAFLERIYLNVLDRPSDAAGRQFYLDLLDDGRISKSLALADIAVSPENAMESTHVLMGLYESGAGEWAFL